MSEDAKHTAQYKWENIRDRNRPRGPSVGERQAFGDGWEAAMKFMTSPRIPAPVCAVMDGQGRHCPEPPRFVARVNGGKEIALCPKCYENARAGAYGCVIAVGYDPPFSAEKASPPKEHNPHGLVAFYTDAP